MPRDPRPAGRRRIGIKVLLKIYNRFRLTLATLRNTPIWGFVVSSRYPPLIALHEIVGYRPSSQCLNAKGRLHQTNVPATRPLWTEMNTVYFSNKPNATLVGTKRRACSPGYLLNDWFTPNITHFFSEVICNRGDERLQKICSMDRVTSRQGTGPLAEIRCSSATVTVKSPPQTGNPSTTFGPLRCTPILTLRLG